MTAAAHHLCSIEDLVDRLDGQLEALCARLLPAGRAEHGYWVEASQARGGLGDSLKVTLRHPHRGRWQHYSAGERGDALGLIAYLETRGDMTAAIKWAQAFLGMAAGDASLSPGETARLKRDAEARRRAAAADDAKRRRVAAGIFHSAQARIAGTPADLYLKGRGIDLAALGHQPGALRFHPALHHPERGWGPQAPTFPAMVAAIIGAAGDLVGVHRTYLEVLPGGRVVKLRGVDAAKCTLGPYSGGCVRLWRGTRADPKTGEIRRARSWRELEEGTADPKFPGGRPADWYGVAGHERSALICEGIEDGLVLAQALPDWRVLVALSLANMGSMALPPAIAEAVVLADNDGDNAQARAGLDRALRHLATVNCAPATPRAVRVAMPDGAKDVNDMVKPEPEGE